MGYRVVVTAALVVAGIPACEADQVAPSSPETSPGYAKAPGGGITVIRLPTLGGHAEAFAVNDAGEAVGYSVQETSVSRAVRWTNQAGQWVIERIGVLSTSTSTSVRAINEAGTMVGWSGRDAVLWHRDGTVEILGPGEAGGINAGEIAVGFRADGVARPAAWTRSGTGWAVVDLPELPGGATLNCFGSATGISDDGTIVGNGQTPDCRTFAVQWKRKPDLSGWEPAERLAATDGAAQSMVHAIGGSLAVGTVWPCAAVSGCSRLAVRWDLAGGLTESLGSLDARANGLNGAGLIVGSHTSSGNMKAFVWSSATAEFRDLPAVNRYGTYWAWDINNSLSPRSTKHAVGAGIAGSGAKIPLLWVIP